MGVDEACTWFRNHLLSINIDMTDDSNLLWKSHIDSLVTKVSSKVGPLKRLRSFLPQKLLCAVYFALIQSNFDYGITIWDNCAKYLQNSSQRVQNKAARVILNNYSYET